MCCVKLKYKSSYIKRVNGKTPEVGGMQGRKNVAFSGIQPDLSLLHLVSPAAMALATATSSARYKVNILARSNHAASRTEKQKVIIS